ncbi:O-methyltransferase-domain-containing protein [Massariosphaeria phaeospora]|uniref:O-methyltransferase-domain-containing protein n=1 Tax=Massariosphaeria phaeospora TaxID=100035 RepID=A0A7C8MHQ7_9PLEO|nr:O-methyltransferase-domain-containing protein [Massariosphaeria phaeospora]
MASLTAKAEAILAHAKQLDAALEEKNLPYPSIHVDPLDDLPAEYQDLRASLANGSNELKKLARGAVMDIMDITFCWTDAVPLLVIYHYNLAKAVPLEGTASYAEISGSSGLHEDLCRRFIRCAMGSNLFDEDPATGRVRHTASSRKLATDSQLHDSVGLQLEDIAPAALRLPKVWNRHGHDVGEQSRTAFSMENQSDLPTFGIYAAEPERGRRFGSAMGHYTKGDSWDLRHILTAFDWTAPELDYPGATIVDIGGGHGQISYFLAQHTKHVRFVVQDLPEVVEVGRSQRSQVSDTLKSRVDFLAHSFLEPQQATEDPPAAFLLRYILHNWSDKYAVQILQNLRPALRPGTKILIYEYVLEDKPVTDLSARFGFQLDMIMAAMFNGKERRRVDFEKLLKAADSRFVLNAVRMASGRTMHIVEVVWTG